MAFARSLNAFAVRILFRSTIRIRPESPANATREPLGERVQGQP